MSVCLSSLLRSQFCNRFWWNFAQLFGARKVRTLSLGVKIRWLLPLFCPDFSPRNAFSMGRSEHSSNETRGPTVAVNSSNDVSREALLRPKLKCYNPCFPSKTRKWESMHFNGNRAYAWLNVWCIVSQQPSEINGWFQRTTYMKSSYIASPTVACTITSRDPKRSKSWTVNPKSLRLHSSTTVRGKGILPKDHL